MLTAFAVMPILAVAAAHKSYIFPVCMALLYIFLGFFITSISMYLHPVSSISVIIARGGNIQGLAFADNIHVPLALLCIVYLGCTVRIVCYFFATQKEVR